MDETNVTQVSEEVILKKIFEIRLQRVMLDGDLAELYGVETKQLKRAVRRNEKRFPQDFMFELSLDEFENLRCQSGTSSWGGVRYLPMAFTEQGIAMLSSVLNSERAVQVNIRIIRIFTRMKKMLLEHQEIFTKLREIERTVSDHDKKILLIFEYIKQLEERKQHKEEQQNRRPIGFKRDRNESENHTGG